MNLKYILVLIALSFALILPTANAVQLAYDDGTRDSQLDLDSTYRAVKFTPLHTGNLESVAVFLQKTSNSSDEGTLRILNSSHSVLKSQNITIPRTNSYSWRSFSIQQEVKKNSDFYASIKSNNNSRRVSLGTDRTSPDRRSEYRRSEYLSSTWRTETNQDYMIRANFNYYPTVENLSISPTPTNQDFITITADCTDYENFIAGAEYRIDNGTWQPMIAEDGSFSSLSETVLAVANVSSLADGQHTAEVRCIDSDAYKTDSEDYAQETFFLDNIAPVSEISFTGTMGENNWYISNVEAQISATDESSAIKYIEYQLLGATESPAQSFSSSSKTFTLSENGTTTIYYRAQDNAGNWEASKNTSIQIDTIAPTVPVLNSFVYDYLNGTTQAITWNNSTDATSGVAYYILERKVNSGDFSEITKTSNLSYTDSDLSNNNQYTYRVKAVDYAGNTSNYSTTEYFSVDMSKPSTPYLYSLDWITNNTTINLSWTQATDSGTFPSGVYSYDMRENGTTTDNITLHPTTNYDDIGNSEGWHRYNIRAKDNAEPSPNIGNWSNQAYTLLDTTPPTTTSRIFPNTPNGNNNWYITKPFVMLFSNDSSGIEGLYYCIDSTGTCTPETKVNSMKTFYLEEGINYVNFYAKDRAGNIETTKTIGPIYVDITKPYNQSILLDNDATYNTTGSVSANPLDTGADNISGLDYCELSWDNGVTWENTSLATSWGPYSYSDGWPIAQYKCTDIAGNASDIVMDSIIVDTTRPISLVAQPLSNAQYIKGETKISGISFDATSGIEEVQIKIEHRTQEDDSWETVLDWTTTNGTMAWDYDWKNNSQSNGLYRVISKAKDKAGWIENEREKVRFQLVENTSPSFDNIYSKEEGTKYVSLFGYFDRTATEYTIEIFNLENGINSEAIYTYTAETDNQANLWLPINVDKWETNILYGARILLVNGDTLYTQFDTLAASAIIDNINSIENELAELWEADTVQAEQISELSDKLEILRIDLSDLEDRLDDFELYVEERLDDLEARITSLENDLIGFRDIIVSTHITTYYVNTAQVPISFGLKPRTSGLYKIEYKVNNGTWKTLSFCNWFNADTKTYKNGKITIQETGDNLITLRAVRCGTNQVRYTSQTYTITNTDLKDSLESATTIISPNENSKTDFEYPVGSISNGIYWTQSGQIPLVAYLTTNTELDRPKCEVYYDDSKGVERHIGNYSTFSDNEKGWVCNIADYGFTTEEWGNTNYSETYTTIRVYNNVVAQSDSYAEIKIGIDNTPPEILSIVPDEQGIMNGIYTWYSEIKDNLSGISQVDFYLIEKQGEEYCGVCEQDCHIGTGEIVWATTDVPYNSESGKFYYNLDTTNHPDGHYNVGFKATDIAGNYTYLEIDPVIDNTPPSILNISYSPEDTKFRGESVEIKATVTDNMSGVKEVIAKVTNPNNEEIEIVLTGKGNNIYSGFYETTLDSLAEPENNTYTVTINAKDNADNLAAQKTYSFILNYKYILDIFLEKSIVYSKDKVILNGTIMKDDGTVPEQAEIILSYTNGTNLENETIFLEYNIETGEITTKEFKYDYLGEYTFTAKILAPNGIEFIDMEKVSIVPTSTPNESNISSTGGGGGGGSSSSKKITEEDSEETPEEETPEEETPEEEGGQTEESNQEDNEGNQENEGTLNTQIGNQENSQGTGFFGLGEGITPEALGLVFGGVVLIGGAAYLLFFKPM